MGVLRACVHRGDNTLLQMRAYLEFIVCTVFSPFPTLFHLLNKYCHSRNLFQYLYMHDASTNIARAHVK